MAQYKELALLALTAYLFFHAGVVLGQDLPEKGQSQAARPAGEVLTTDWVGSTFAEDCDKKKGDLTSRTYSLTFEVGVLQGECLFKASYLGTYSCENGLGQDEASLLTPFVPKELKDAGGNTVRCEEEFNDNDLTRSRVMTAIQKVSKAAHTTYKNFPPESPQTQTVVVVPTPGDGQNYITVLRSKFIIRVFLENSKHGVKAGSIVVYRRAMDLTETSLSLEETEALRLSNISSFFLEPSVQGEIRYIANFGNLENVSKRVQVSFIYLADANKIITVVDKHENP